jgi:hypothetical protein
MGQENTCGICGKYYQACRHYMKLHLPDKNGNPLCGRKIESVIVEDKNWKNRDIDPYDFCKSCLNLMRRRNE